MTILRFPPEAHGLSIEALDLTVRARNALRRNDYETLGDLDGIPVAVLAALPHVGRTTADEVVSASVRVVERIGTSGPPPAGAMDEVAVSLFDEVEHGWLIPGDFAGSPVSALGLPPKSISALLSRGIHTLGDLRGLTLHSVQTRLNLAAGPAQRLASALESLLSIDPAWLRKVSRGGDAEAFLLPKCGPGVLAALRRADDAAEELDALLGGFVDRDRRFLLSRWCYFDSAQPTLDSLASEAGITRERVRQIIERAEQQLQASEIVLPHASLLVAVLRDAGGLLTTQQFQERIARSGLRAEAGLIRALPHLARLKLVPRVAFDTDLDLWVTGPGEDLVASGRLSDVLRRVSRFLKRQLRTRSCIDLDTLSGKLPFGAEHALKLAAPRCTGAEWVGAYGIPVPLTRSKLTNAALKLLAVSRSLPLEQTHVALGRVLGPAVPPPEVLGRVLALHPQIVLEENRVRADGSLLPDEVLSAAERTAVALFAAGGNVLLAGNFIDAMIRSGFSLPMASVILRRPYVRRIGAGIYGLRGHPIHRDTVRSRIQERSRERNRNVVTSQMAGDQVVVRYRLTRFSRTGVLAQPKELRGISGIWTSHFPDGTEAPLKLDNGFVWTIQPWLKQLKAVEGDFVIGAFRPAVRQVSWEYESASR
jgi:hypothetical protein